MRCAGVPMSSENSVRETSEDSEQKIVFHQSYERGLIKLCNQCQATPHYCVARSCKPETNGCICFYFLPDLKTLRYFTPFTWEEAYRGYIGEKRL